MPFIRESIVITRHNDGTAHIAPLGVHETKKGLLIAPFKPSATYNNLLREGVASINYTDDVRIYAGCLTDHRNWPTCDTDHISGTRLADCLAHTEVKAQTFEDDEQRPRFYCETIHEATHKPFHGYNRAQFSVIELAILVSRLHMLTAKKIDSEIDYLRIGFEKTSGPREQEAWNWLMEKITQYRTQQDKVNES